MKYRTLGKTGIQVSEIGVGAWQMGGLDFLDGQSHGWHGTSDGESLALLRLAGEKGVNFIDTAPNYGGGHSEEVIGEALQDRRDKWVVCTKVGWAKGGGGERITDMKPGFIRESLEASLKRLKSDYVDVFLLHYIPEPHEREAAVRLMQDLKKEGKAKAIGVSAAWFPGLQELDAISPGWIEVVQDGYSLLDRGLEGRLPWIFERQMGVIIRSSLAMGMLSGKYWDNPDQIPEGDIRRQWFIGKEKASFLKPLEFLQAGGKRTQIQAAVRFVLDNPAVSTVITGVKNPAQMEENLQACDVPSLSDEERRRAFEIVG